MALALQLAGSLIAILLLAWLAHRLGLGGDSRIHSAEDARVLADEAVHGFATEEVAIDAAGLGALCRDRAGRVLLLRRHGSHWAGRLLDAQASAQLEAGRLTLATPDRRFGAVTLDLGGEASAWVERLGRATG